MYSQFRQRVRLHPELPSPTQICGGIRPQFQFGHPTEARGLTVHERARIQSFPDHYCFHGGVVQGRVRAGNAVPPFLAEVVAAQILRVLRGEQVIRDTDEVELAQVGLFAWADFPWRRPGTSPFVVLVSELLLRKTRRGSVASVLPRLLKRFPNPEALARARKQQLQVILRPLGLHRIRAAGLVRLGRILVETHGGRVPADLKHLLALPHLGRYGAHAVRCFAFGRADPIVDTNVARVLGRYFGITPLAQLHTDDRTLAAVPGSGAPAQHESSLTGTGCRRSLPCLGDGCRIRVRPGSSPVTPGTKSTAVVARSTRIQDEPQSATPRRATGVSTCRPSRPYPSSLDSGSALRPLLEGPSRSHLPAGDRRAGGPLATADGGDTGRIPFRTPDELPAGRAAGAPSSECLMIADCRVVTCASAGRPIESLGLPRTTRHGSMRGTAVQDSCACP